MRQEKQPIFTLFDHGEMPTPAPSDDIEGQRIDESGYDDQQASEGAIPPMTPYEEERVFVLTLGERIEELSREIAQLEERRRRELAQLEDKKRELTLALGTLSSTDLE